MTTINYPKISLKDYLSVVGVNTEINITSLNFFEQDFYKGTVANFFMKYKVENLELVVNHVSILDNVLIIQVYKKPE